jgi:DNA replication protein DnaC
MDDALIAKQLVRLRLTGMKESLEQRLAEAMKDKWSYSTFFEILLSDEIERRENKQLTLRLVKSRLSPEKTLETFDFAFNPKVQPSLIKELSTCRFIEKKQNIFILGPSGVGKSHLAQALGHEACRKGHEVLFYCTHQLFEWIYAGRGDGTHKRRLGQVIKTPVLVLDDFGLQNLNEVQQSDLYQLIAERYEKASTIITSNRDFDEWPSIFINPLLGSAALDRLVHRGVQIVIEGESYRLSEFKKSNGRSKKGVQNHNKTCN